MEERNAERPTDVELMEAVVREIRMLWQQSMNATNRRYGQ